MSSAGSLLPDWLAHRAATTPERTALEADGRVWSFAELDRDVTALALRLASHGVAAGDRVATLLHDGAAPALVVHALLRLGATLVPLNLRLRDAEIAWQLRDAAPRLLLADARNLPLARAALLQAEGAALLAVDALLQEDGPDVAAPADSLRLAHPIEHPLAIIYTSGTTGSPKGALLTVGNFWWSAVGSALNLGVHADDRWLACLPLFHVGGLSILLRSAIYGIAAVVQDGFDAEAVNAAIDRDRITIVSVVAVMLGRMLDSRGGRPFPATLRCVLLGGGPAPRLLLERCAERGVPVVQTYGLTEAASQVATLAPEDALRRLGSAGRALYPNTLRIARPDGTTAAADEAGEILVRGPVVMAGYAGRVEDSARTLADGWLHTGDLGRIDAEGYLFVLDRRDDLIITGGENVYPAEVEAALLSHPEVLEAAVVGLTDEQWGQRVIAVVRTRDAAHPAGTAAALRAHCRAMLAGYKTPSEIRFMAEPLPRTASGKLRRGTVREWLEMQPPVGESPTGG